VGKHSRKRGRVYTRNRLDTPKPGTSRRAGDAVEAAPRMRIHHERRNRAIKRAAASLALLVLVAVGCGAAYVYSQFAAAGRIMEENALQSADMGGALSEREPKKPYTILLLGTDYREGEEAARADTIILARVDPEQGRVWMLSIPRDTRVEIPGYGVDKINAAHFYGGPKLMAETVTALTGVPINHYAEIDFQGFAAGVDALGGVWVDVDVEIDDWKAASGVKNREPHIEPGYQRLNGAQALTYVRSRDFPDADFTRMRHQQTFFKALADQATQIDSVFKIPPMVKDVAGYLTTDMTVAQLVESAMDVADIGGDNVETATLEGEWRSPYVWLDEEKKEQLVGAMMAGRSFDEQAEEQTEEIDRSTISITVRNGAGIEGSASVTSDILSTLGYTVTEVGNANQFVYEETLVVYATDHAAAVQVASDLPKAKVVESRGMYAFSTDILVVVGDDYATWDTTTATPQ
jgi:LCP family protein required for cell wall assembly